MKFKKKTSLHIQSNNLDPKSLAGIWAEIKSLLLKERTEYRPKIGMYADVRRKSVIDFSSYIPKLKWQSSTDGCYEDVKRLKNKENEVESFISQVPPYPNSFLYEYLNSCQHDQIRDLKDRIFSTISQTSNLAKHAESKSTKLAEVNKVRKKGMCIC